MFLFSGRWDVAVFPRVTVTYFLHPKCYVMHFLKFLSVLCSQRTAEKQLYSLLQLLHVFCSKVILFYGWHLRHIIKSSSVSKNKFFVFDSELSRNRCKSFIVWEDSSTYTTCQEMNNLQMRTWDLQQYFFVKVKERESSESQWIIFLIVHTWKRVCYGNDDFRLKKRILETVFS